MQFLNETDDSHGSESHNQRPPGHVRRDVSEDNADDESDYKPHDEMESLVEATFVRAEVHLRLIEMIKKMVKRRITPNIEKKITQSAGRSKS